MNIPRCGGLGVDGHSTCTHEVTEVVGDVPLCLLHRSRIAKELSIKPRPVMTLLPEATIQPEAKFIGDFESITYYAGDPDTSLVKIGTTMCLFKRLTQLRRIRPRLLLLATEPGNEDVERERHRQFRSLRNPLPNGEREWFRKAPILMEYVGHVRLRYGILLTDRLPRMSWVAPLTANADAAPEPHGNDDAQG